jgi:hypothetical protein
MVGGKKEKGHVGTMGMHATDGAPCMCCMTIGFAVAIHIATWNAGRSVARSLFFHSRLHDSHNRNADWMLVPRRIQVWLWVNHLRDDESGSKLHTTRRTHHLLCSIHDYFGQLLQWTANVRVAVLHPKTAVPSSSSHRRGYNPTFSHVTHLMQQSAS